MSERHPILVPVTNANDRVAKLVAWLGRHGERVTEGTPVALIETSKAATEIEAPADGTLCWALPAGLRVAVGAPIGWIAPPDSAPPAAPSNYALPERAATKAAKGLAAEHGLDIRTIAGEGLVTEALVRVTLGLADTVAEAGPADALARRDLGAHRPTAPEAASNVAAPIPAFVSRSAAKQPIDAFIAKSSDLAITPTDLFLRALGLALADFTAWRPAHASVDVIAVAIGDSRPILRAPTIRAPGSMTLEEIAAWRIREMRGSVVKSLELPPPTFAFSNLAAQGIELFVPNLFSALKATMGLGMRPGAEARWMLCLSFDHQTSDGVYAARFLDRLSHLVENPEALAHA